MVHISLGRRAIAELAVVVVAPREHLVRVRQHHRVVAAAADVPRAPLALAVERVHERRRRHVARGTLRRAAEASALLRVASESGHFARAAARLSREDGEALTRGDMTLRRLATTAEGARLASARASAGGETLATCRSGS